ncbi:MAG: hypothetical protein J3R72DRAFT_508843 [Linnemannia gamsii]|nr:MAG: hypothetical protein J3R72DRAFT_508843 [Linnemannia gamsii]
MQFTLFQGLTVLACSLAVQTMGLSMCRGFETLLLIPPVSLAPMEDPDAPAAAAPTASSPARRRSYPAIVKRALWDDVVNYFKNYRKALGMIVKGDFGEGLFQQLKNSGSWCNKSSWIVKAAKKIIEKRSGSGLITICECLVPMIDKHGSFNKLKDGVGAEGLTDVLKGCSDNMRNQIKTALKKSGGIVMRTGGIVMKTGGIVKKTGGIVKKTGWVGSGSAVIVDGMEFFCVTDIKLRVDIFELHINVSQLHFDQS